MTKKTGVSNRRLLIAKNSIMMLVLLVVIFLAVFAWYNNTYSVTAEEVQLSAAAPEELEIAVTENGADSGPIGSYVTTHNSETNTDETNFEPGVWSDKANFSGPFQFTNDVTSDGLTFIIPKFISTENNPVAIADARTNGKIVNINGIPDYGGQLKTNLDNLEEGETPNYVKIPFYLRSRSKDLYIKSSGYLAMGAETGIADEKGNTAITGSNSARKSSYGDFTSDALVAAMRVSITGGPVASISNNIPTRTNNNDECTFVWVPRPDLFLNIPENENSNWSLGTGITKSTPLQRIGETYPTGSTYKHNHYELRYVDPEAATPVVNGVTLVEDESTDNSEVAYKSDLSKTVSLTNGTVPTLGRGKKITGFQTEASAIDDYYYYKFYLNIWIEGTDSEARRAMDTGRFSLKLEFGSSGD